MRGSRLLIAFAFVALSSVTGQAGPVLDRIHAQGVIRCGGKPRPGLADTESDKAGGLLLDLCRAIGAGVLGPNGRIEFHEYDSAKSFDAVRDATDDVYFLDGTDIIDNEGVADAVVPGPPVFFERTAIMVAEASPIRHLADLADKAVCFSQGTNAHRHVEAWFAAHHLNFQRMGYQEDVELLDTYNAQVCPALAGEETTLAESRLDTGVNHLRSRLLPEPLAVFPILAATGTRDAEWSAIVAWTVAMLVRPDAPDAEWTSGGLLSVPVAAPKLKLDKAWRERVVATAGSYGEIFRRNLGAGSDLRLDRGLNASWQEGGLFAPPYRE